MTTTQPSRGTLGTFAGVFTPSILTILGIILFLRLGFVVGNGGLRNALIIIGVATAVSVLTSISLAAIATNIDVKGGGDYYMISRTLGVEFGGAIGIVLFLAQSVSIAFYAVGFGEAATAIFGIEADWAAQIVAAIAVLLLFGLAWAGADVASRFQFVVMALLVAALISFYLGAVPGFDSQLAGNGWSSPEGSLSFWVIFAIFFPAVTGFTQGVSMSGDLKDAGRSLPLGTFSAVALSTVVYVSVAILIAGNASSSELIADTSILNSIAAFGPLIDAGVIAATLSSAMASFLGAPRILQSLASDRVFPILNTFAKGHGPTKNPRRAVLLSLGIALATVAIGNLNAIAPVVSMFFLISYGLLNYATYYEARAASPSFRPRFRFFDRRLSLLGALACGAAMVAVNVPAGIGAILILAGIYQYLRRIDRPQRWADASRSYYFQRVKEGIRAMTAEAANPRSWRPQVLAFSADPRRRARLLRFGSWLEGESGLTAAIQIVVGEGALKRKERRELGEALRAEIENLGLDVHGRAVLAPDAMEALPVIVQSFGLGPLRANTVLFGWPEETEEVHLAGYAEAVRETYRLGMNVVSMLSDEERWAALEEVPRSERTIDVWWQDDDSSRLALLSAYLFTRTRAWSRASIRLLGSAPSEGDVAATLEQLRAVLGEARIDARIECFATPSVGQIAKTSSKAAFVMLPAALRQGEFAGPFDHPTALLLGMLPTTAVFMAGSSVDLAAGPETEQSIQLRAAEELVQVAENRLRALQRQQERLEAEMELRSGGSDWEADDIAAAEQRLRRAERRILSTQAKLDSAKADVAALLGGDNNSVEQ
ncbi:MAG: amino acid permease [Acidimicrobiia bacterium]|nr:amino acid permease [Acidimicrobiia bacterium]